MSELDQYFKAFLAYRKVTLNNKELINERLKIKKANQNKDILNSKKYNIEIDSNWIEEIEKGLIFIGKAIKEDRQFIRTNGEIVPIEKAKRVSRPSVTHLARHSNLISPTQREDEDILPKELYQEEKISDYAIYENRFLYLLLINLNEFVRSRYDKINDLSKTMSISYKVLKKVNSASRNLEIEASILDERKDNLYSTLNEDSLKLLSRIEGILGNISMLLHTELMDGVSKEPLIKTPIVKTNVLRMNQNFKAASELFDYISTFEDLGFRASEVKKEFNPLKDEVSDEFADSLGLLSFLAFMNGGEYKDKLLKEYELYLKEEEEKEKKNLDVKIKKLRTYLEDTNTSPYEYIMSLERQNELLKHDREELIKVREHVDELNLNITNLNKEKMELLQELDYERQVTKYKEEAIKMWQDKYSHDMEDLRQSHQYELDSMRQENDYKISKLNEEFSLKTDELNKNYKDEIDTINQNHNLELENLQKENDEKVKSINDRLQGQIELLVDEISNYDEEKEKEIKKYEDLISNMNDEIYDLKTHLDSASKERDEAKFSLDSEVKKAILETKEPLLKENLLKEEKINSLNQKIDELNAMYLGACAKNGEEIDIDSFTSKERFDELEKEYIAFYNLFNRIWKNTKIKIRKDILKPNKKKEE